MASYILKTEITVIPRLLDKYIGKYYNNTLCNGATWMFLSWYILHVIFDDLLNALLRKMRYKEYIRIRLKKSLWYLGFYSTACVYCIATFFQNHIQFYNVKNPFDSTNAPSGHLILGFIVLSTFYLHSAFWEKLKYCHNILGCNYLCLFLLMCLSYFLRFVEGAFRLTILICLTQIALELARCTAVLINRTGFNRKIIGGFFYASSILIFTINYLIVISLLLDPLLRKLSPSASGFLVFLLSWLLLEIYDSVLFKTILHWLNHKGKLSCEKDILECVLFPPRNDATYNFLILRKELKEREEKCLSLRRPKNRNMVMQTLKCMVAIKRKLHQKRHSTPSPKEDNDGSETESQEMEKDDLSEDISQGSDDCDDCKSNKVQELDVKSDNIAVRGKLIIGNPGHQLKTLNRLINSHLEKSEEANGHIKKCKED